MLLLYLYNRNELYFSSNKKVISVYTSYFSIVNAPNITIEKSRKSLDKEFFLNKESDINIGIYEHFIDTCLDQTNDDLLNKIAKNLKNKFKEKNIIRNFLLETINKKKNKEYITNRRFCKITDIISFLFLKDIVNEITKESYFIFIFSVKKRIRGKDLISIITSLIKNVEQNEFYKMIFIVRLLLRISKFMEYNILSDNYVESDIYIEYESFGFYGTILIKQEDSPVQENVIKIISNEKVDLYLRVSRKDKIEILEFITEKESENSLTKPICYKSIKDHSGLHIDRIKQIIQDAIIIKLIRNEFDLESRLRSIKLIDKLFTKDSKWNEKEIDLIRYYFYILFFMSLLDSKEVKKIDSLHFDLVNETYLKSSILSVSFKRKTYGCVVYLRLLEAIIFTDKIIKYDYIESPTLILDVYEASLPFLGESNSFIFPIMRFSKKTGKEHYVIDKDFTLNKKYESTLLDKTLTQELSLEIGKKYSIFGNVLNVLNIRVNYYIE